MPTNTVASGTFPSRRSADQAIHRLVSNGFARNSIDLRRRQEDDSYHVAVHTRPENLERVERLIHASPSMYGIRQAASGASQTATAHPLILLGAGALAGFLIYSLMSRGDD